MKSRLTKGNVVWGLMWVMVGALFAPQIALAVGMALPWDGPLCQFSAALTGKTAFAIGTIAFFAAAAGFIWGEQLSGILKGFVNAAIAVAFMIGSSAFINAIAASMGNGPIGC